MSNAPLIADASTVILLRDGAHGLETFLLKRHGKSGFMAGAHVFPGGRVDPADCDLGLPHEGRAPEHLPFLLDEQQLPIDRSFGLFVAGVRETLEESGVFLGRSADPAKLTDAARRDAPSFRAMLESSDARVGLDRLVPYARWITPPIEKKRFDTRFFFCRCDESESDRARHDGVETTEGQWFEPGRALELEHGREMFLAPPTLRTLQELAEVSTVDEAIALGARRPLPLVRPSVAQLDGGIVLTLPGDPLHPEQRRALPGPTRLRWDEGRWISENA
jgi:8-oxo-dGTP pyrophosphatase MutT (NUDIX family)